MFDRLIHASVRSPIDCAVLVVYLTELQESMNWRKQSTILNYYSCKINRKHYLSDLTSSFICALKYYPFINQSLHTRPFVQVRSYNALFMFVFNSSEKGTLNVSRCRIYTLVALFLPTTGVETECCSYLYDLRQPLFSDWCLRCIFLGCYGEDMG